MSWDIVLFNSKQKIESVEELDENQLEHNWQIYDSGIGEMIDLENPEKKRI